MEIFDIQAEAATFDESNSPDGSESNSNVSSWSDRIMREASETLAEQRHLRAIMKQLKRNDEGFAKKSLDDRNVIVRRFYL